MLTEWNLLLFWEYKWDIFILQGENNKKCVALMCVTVASYCLFQIELDLTIVSLLFWLNGHLFNVWEKNKPHCFMAMNFERRNKLSIVIFNAIFWKKLIFLHEN